MSLPSALGRLTPASLANPEAEISHSPQGAWVYRVFALIRRAGGWDKSSMATERRRNEQFAEPPQSLQRHIWPWLDEAAEMYALGYASGQGSDLDQFVKLLLELRVVLLQDSALLMPRFPKLPLWKHPVFSHGDWSRFAEQPLVASKIAALNRNQPVRTRPAWDNCALGCREGSEELTRHSDHRPIITQQIAQNQAPRRLLPVPPEAVKESLLNDSPAGLGHAPYDCRSLQSNTQAPPVAAVLQHEPRDCPDGWPVDPITPSMKSMAEVWQEWHHGLGRNPSVVELDKRFSNKWRYNSKIWQRCSIRKRFGGGCEGGGKPERCPSRGRNVISLMDKIKASDGHRLSPDKISRLLS
ncbi:hypothetical protein V8E54_011488 [Elaphomyces granulatus]